MPKSSRMQRIYPWLVAVFVLLPALAAWQLQRTQHARDVERFRLLIRDQSPLLLQGSTHAQDIANRAANALAREGEDYDVDALESSLGEWRLRDAVVVGYGNAVLNNGHLRLSRQALREGQARLEIGADLLEAPELKTAWDDMLREGRGGTSAPAPWLRDSPRRFALVLRVAYSGGPLPPTEAARRAAARGVGFCLIDADRLWEQGAAKIDRRLLTVERMADDAPLQKRDFDRTSALGLGGGYAWKARFTPGPEFFTGETWRAPFLVSTLGLLLAGFTFALARAQSRQRAAVEALAETLDARVTALTDELRAENSRLRAAQIETELALAREQESGELKSRVVATISHEFRTPLSVILSSA